MGKFVEETYQSIQDRVCKWDELGMLESVKCEDSRKLVSMVLDATALYLIQFNYTNIDKNTKTCLIPIMIKLFRDTNYNFTMDEINKFVKKIIEEFTIKHQKFYLINTSIENDEETEFIIQFCKDFKFN